MMRNKKVRRAIVPAAGKGTRLSPLTRIVPKEMLPLGRRPVLEYIVEEIVTAGIEELLFVISEDKRSIIDYFKDFLGLKIESVIQPEQRGLGDAVIWGESFADGEPFAVVLGDSIISTDQDQIPLRRVLDTYEQTDAKGVIVVQDTPPEEAHRYGMVKPKQVAETASISFEIEDLIEKPRPNMIPSRFAIAGRYAFDSKIFHYLRNTRPGAGGEIQLTDAIKDMLADGNPVRCVPLGQGEVRRDIGTFESYFEAFTIICTQDSECGESYRRMLKELQK